jgi:hypothetical protein
MFEALPLLLQWLADRQIVGNGPDRGAIFDPLDGRPMGEHYAHTHFAWVCAMMHRREGGDEWLSRAMEAVEFHIRTSPDEYPPGDWDYHWDFNNLAFAETCALLRERLDAPIRKRWEDALLAWKTNPHSATNWLAMRALGAWKRGTLLDRPSDHADAEEWLNRVFAAQTADGCFDDISGQSRPSQYHAYTAALLHRMREFAPERIEPTLIPAARWLLAATGPDGDTTALGRGQGQIFGCVAAAYLFRAVALLDPGMAPYYLWVADRILEKLRKYQTELGWIPLVLNDVPVSERAGWYDYHHLTVYNAFAAVWLLLAEEIPAATEARRPPPVGDILLEGSRVLSIRRDDAFSLWAAGETGHGYAADAGIAPHFLHFQDIPVFRYPVGPGPGKYGERVPHPDQAQNIWAPILREEDGPWIGPFGGRGEIREIEPRRWELTYGRGPYFWRRKLTAGKFFMEAVDRLSEEKNAPPPVLVRTANAAMKPGIYERVGRNAFRIRSESHSGEAESPLLRLWGEGGDARIAGETTAADGRVDILAVETIRTGKRFFDGGWRLRKGPRNASAHALPGILCLSWDPWSPVWKRKQRLMHEMARTGRAGTVLYAEPPVTGTQVVEGYGHWRSDGEIGRRYRRAMGGKSHPRGSRFRLLTPMLPLPGQRSFRKIRAWNRRFRIWQLRKQARELGLKGHVLWLYHPSQVEFLDELGPDAELIVYDWTDDWVAAFPSERAEKEKRRLAEAQEILLKRADVVFGVSEELCRRAREFGPWVYHLPNATDTDAFAPAAPDSEPHPVFAGRPRPYLVYLSQITERVDFALIEALAARRPEWHFFLIGPAVCPEARLDSLRRFPNVQVPGPLPYESAARAVARADVCILPHKVDDLTRTLDPIKLYDYLATGRPVVSAGVAMNPALPPHIEIADGPDEFEAAILRVLSEPESESRRRRAASLEHNWKARAQTALDILGRFF